METHLVDLSRPLVAGESAYSWLPAPRMSEFLSREASRARYAPGTEFVIHQLELIGNSATYLDALFHRHRNGLDLEELPLERVANLPGVVFDLGPSNDLGEVLRRDPAVSLLRKAVLFRTGWDQMWGTAAYETGYPFITGELARSLEEEGVALVGIDALNVDDSADLGRPAHTILLEAGIPIVENLWGLERLPAEGFRFYAVPVKVRGGSAFPVRAFAKVE